MIATLEKEMKMPTGYDKLSLDRDLLLDLTFAEGTGVLTMDRAKPHHEDVRLANPPTWTQLANHTPVLQFDGATNYMELAAAASADLDFTSEDYSIAAWTFHSFSAQSQMIVARYGLDMDGWELYFYDSPPNHYLQLRHHHASFCPTPPCPPGNERTGCYSNGWGNDIWYLVGLSRIGSDPRMYRNGVGVEVTCGAGDLHNPDNCNRDLVIGCRFTKDADWYKGYMGRIRIWGRALSALEWRMLWNMERHKYGW
jgi:hypothetical protein